MGLPFPPLFGRWPDARKIRLQPWSSIDHRDASEIGVQGTALFWQGMKSVRGAGEAESPVRALIRIRRRSVAAAAPACRLPGTD
jgi:hypothetical protein